MSELEDKLNALLSDPDGMSQVLELAQKLSGQHDAAEAAPAAAAQEEPHSPLSALLGGEADGEALRRLLPLLERSARPESGEAAALLYALRPFLREERRGKVERAVQLARMLSLGRAFLSDGEEAGDV